MSLSSPSATVDAIASFAWPLFVQAGGIVTLDSGRLALAARARTAQAAG